jgi:hypothetical protein
MIHGVLYVVLQCRVVLKDEGYKTYNYDHDCLLSKVSRRAMLLSLSKNYLIFHLPTRNYVNCKLLYRHETEVLYLVSQCRMVRY